MWEDSRGVRSFNAPCHCGRRHDEHGSKFRTHNLCMMRSAYNPQPSISGWTWAGVLAPGRGMEIPRQRVPQQCPWVILAFSASAFSVPPLAVGRPAEVPRPLDWDRPWANQGWGNLRGLGLPEPG